MNSRERVESATKCNLPSAWRHCERWFGGTGGFNSYLELLSCVQSEADIFFKKESPLPIGSTVAMQGTNSFLANVPQTNHRFFNKNSYSLLILCRSHAITHPNVLRNSHIEIRPTSCGVPLPMIHVVHAIPVSVYRETRKLQSRAGYCFAYLRGSFAHAHCTCALLIHFHWTLCFRQGCRTKLTCSQSVPRRIPAQSASVLTCFHRCLHHSFKVEFVGGQCLKRGKAPLTPNRQKVNPPSCMDHNLSRFGSDAR